MNSILSRFKHKVLIAIVLFPTVLLAQKSAEELKELKEAAQSHPKISMVELSQERETPSFIAVERGTQAAGSNDAKALLATTLNLRAGIDELREVRQVNTGGNFTVIEFHQYYKGVKVEHSRYTALVRGGQVLFFNGAYFNLPATAPLTPQLAKATALDKAKQTVKARKYAWEGIEEKIKATKDAKVRGALQKELAEYLPEGELVFVEDFSKGGLAEMRLAYKFNIYAVDPVSRAWIYIDAANGKLLLQDKIIKHVDDDKKAPLASVNTTVTTRYAGSRVIKTKLVSGNDPNSGLPLVASNPSEVYVPGSATYILADDTRGNGIETYDLNGVGGLPVSLPPAYTQAKSFTDVNNNWTLAEHKRGAAAEVENDDIAWDAHWGAGVVYDYWKVKQNRLSFDGNDAKIKSYIHSGVGYDNAFWNGSVMTYGDGSFPAPGGFKPLTSLDVCGHEIGHGVCEFTADLVYAKESGAMNEGFSDVWAACVEYFAIKTVDPALASRYKPFYIGEQISTDPTQPLRRMDDPKAQGNPDTYGGVNWTSQVGCSPTLANDQCGVHNNSGVLNKWFYLLTAGSGAGSGPDAAFAGVDDGVNDKGNAYTVTGLGFAVAERIAYLTELMLTSTATFDEARTVSINVAKEFSGNPCSPVVESVSNAWYAVGVGEKFIKPCTVTFGFLTQPGLAVSESSSPNGCASQKVVNVSVLMPANSTGAIYLTGTAKRAEDYAISATSLSNTTAQTVKKDVAVTVYNDGFVESNETLILTLSLTNLGTNKINKTYTMTLLDDDVVPTIGNIEKTLLNETFTRANGFAEPTGWTEKLEFAEAPNGDPLASGKNQWGIFSNRLAITGKEGATGAVLPGGTYNSNSESRTLVVSPQLDARGLSVLKLSFNYRVQGEVDPASANPDDIENIPAFDYMAVAFSLDGVNFTELNSDGFRQFAAVTPTDGVFNGVLPASLSNKQFYLAFRWSNDANAGGPVSVAIDNLKLTGSTRKIENTLNHSGNEMYYASQEVYFYSSQDGEVLGKLKNNSTKNFGCTNLSIDKAGTGAFTLYTSATTGVHKVADKILRIQSSLIRYSTSITLFFTEDQLKALETATGKLRTAFTVYQVDASSYTTATPNNVFRYTPTYTALPGVGGTFTFTVTNKIHGSYAVGAATTAPVTTAVQVANSKELSEDGVSTLRFDAIYPNPGSSTALIGVSSPKSQKVTVEIVAASGQTLSARSEQLQWGKTQLNLEVGGLKNGSYLVRIRDENGALLNAQTFIKK